MRFRENFSLLPANTQREHRLCEKSRISANLQLCGPNSCHARILRISTRQFITIIIIYIYQESAEKQKNVRRQRACNRRHSSLETMANTRAILIDKTDVTGWRYLHTSNFVQIEIMDFQLLSMFYYSKQWSYFDLHEFHAWNRAQENLIFYIRYFIACWVSSRVHVVFVRIEEKKIGCHFIILPVFARWAVNFWWRNYVMCKTLRKRSSNIVFNFQRNASMCLWHMWWHVIWRVPKEILINYQN